MTHQEIDKWGQELRDIVATLRRSPRSQRDIDEAKTHLRELATKVGASEYAPGGESDATVSQFVYNIHQALQTASMIDACRTGAENVRLAENAQRDASRAQQIAFWSMLAAWGAVVVNIVVAYIMAGKA